MPIDRGDIAGGLLDPGAAALVKMDAAIQALTKKIDGKVEAGLAKLEARPVKPPDISCTAKQAAIPVSLAMRAVQYGALKVALRVLPRMIETVIRAHIYGMVERGLAAVAAFGALKKIPGAGNLLSLIIGVVHEVDYNREMEAKIREVLGCAQSDIDREPMRAALNKLVTDMQARNRDEPRPVGPVRTRKGS